MPYEYLHADEEGSVGFSSGERVVEGGGGGVSRLYCFPVEHLFLGIWRLWLLVDDG